MGGRSILLVGGMLLASTVSASPQNSDRFLQATRMTTFPVRIQDDLVYIPTEIGGRHLWFVLDSGSSRVLLDRSLAAGLGLKMEGASSLQGAGAGRIPIQSVRNVEIGVPGIESTYAEISTIDLKGSSQEVVKSVDGILGYDFLARFVVAVDYEHSTVTVQAPETFIPPLRRKPFPLHSMASGQLLRLSYCWPTM